MSTFPRGHSARQQLERNRKIIEKINGDLKTKLIVRGATAADGITLRGIPAVGRGVTGAITGTRPDAITDAA